MQIDELAIIYPQWAFLFRLFEYCKHPKYGTYTNLPCAGGVLNQPAKTMAAMDVMREVWIQKLQKEMNATR